MVVCNVSRRIVAEARAAGPPVSVVEITAPPAVLAQRLAARGQPEDDDRAARLARAGQVEADLRIGNIGTPEAGAAQLVAYLRGCRAEPARAGPYRRARLGIGARRARHPDGPRDRAGPEGGDAGRVPPVRSAPASSRSPQPAMSRPGRTRADASIRDRPIVRAIGRPRVRD